MLLNVLRTARFGLWWLLLWGPPLVSQDVRRISLPEATRLFVVGGPALAASRADARQAAGVARQAAAWPNPTLDLSHESLSDAGRTARESYITVRQQVPWPWTNAAVRRAAGRIGEAAAARAEAEEVDLHFAVREAYLAAAFAEAAHAAAAEAIGDVRRAESDMEQRAAVGDVSGYALRRLRVERARYEVELAELAVQVAQTRLALTGLVGADGDVLLAPDGFPQGAVPAPAVTAGSERPVVAAARAQVAAARARVGSAAAPRWPALTLLGGLKTQADGLRGLYVGVGLPLPLFDWQGPAVDAANAGVAAAEARLAGVTHQARSDEVTARAALDAQVALGRVLAADIPLDPNGLVTAARVSYAEGEGSLLEFLDAINAAREARVLTARHQRDLWMAAFALQRVLGSDASEGVR